MNAFVSTYFRSIMLVASLAVLSALFHIGDGFVQKYILDSIVEAQDFVQVAIGIGVYFLLVAGMQIFGALTYYVSHMFGLRVGQDVKNSALQHFEQMRFRDIIDAKEGEIHQIIDKGSNARKSLVDVLGGNILQNGIMLLFGIGVFFSIDRRMGVFLTCIFIPLFVGYSLWDIKRILPTRKRFEEEENALGGGVVEFFSHIRDVRIFGVGSIFLKRFGDTIGKLVGIEKTIEIHHHRMNFVQFCILFGSLCGLIGYTSWHIFAGALSVGTFALVLATFATMRSALWSMIFLYRNIEERKIQIGKLQDFFELPSLLPGSPQGTPLQKDKIGTMRFSGLEIKNLSFGYSRDNAVLQNISFEQKKGERIAIVGRTGAGKTTLVHILLGLFDGYTGNMMLNGKKVSHIPQNMCSYVPQEVQVFHTTLRDNLTLGEKYDDATLVDMLKKVGLEALQKRAAKNETLLDIVVGAKGLKLSSGERQRLGIARALLRERSIYIFDEVTSNLDMDTEKDIIALILAITEGKTCIFITHRQEILEHVERVYEIEQGVLKKK